MWTRENFISEADRNNGEAGVTMCDFGNALCTWIAMSGGRSVSDAATTFATSPDIVIEEVRRHPWMFFTSPGGALVDDLASIDDPKVVLIELEGE